MQLISAHPLARRSSLRSTLVTASVLLGAWSSLQALRLLHSQHRRIDTAAFSHFEDEAVRRFLIVGDSNGVGIGSVDSRSTVPGRLAAAFPGTEVVNQSHDGADTADIARQIESSSGRFDLILIFVGGNDVIRFSRYQTVAEDAVRALDLARDRANHVGVVPPADIGTAPVWLWPLGPLYSRRARNVRRVWQIATSERMDVHLVDLRLARERDPFRIKPRRYYSPDGIHPSADGYALWFAQITRQVPFFTELSHHAELL
ncbi:MAG: GDSL-type esterase/lipase family protein [Burkholderiaceae bacterium]